MSDDSTLDVAVLLLLVFALDEEPVPYHDSIRTGEIYCEELMNTRNEKRFMDVLRMKKPTFIKLVEFLSNQPMPYQLISSVNISAGQKLMIYITALKGFTNREIAEAWQHSGDTISKVINEVANIFDHTGSQLFVRPPLEPPPRISDDPKYADFFSNCLGALDGCHVNAVPKAEESGVFRNRKGTVSQNVLGVINFDLTFSYCLAGWEGSAHDGQVFNDALCNKRLFIVDGKWYLGDAGYALSKYVLTPYRGVRYHLKEWQRRGLRPENAKELFNLRHSSLRNCVERGYGILKKRFPILTSMTSYPMAVQVKLVKSCFMIHNFIRVNASDEDEFDYWQENEDPDNNLDGENAVLGEDAFDSTGMSNFRDEIAEAMWVQYQAYVANHPEMN